MVDGSLKNTPLYSRILPGLILLLTCLPASLLAQEKPYFQQRWDCSISLDLDTGLHSIRASMTAKYVNLSPDTLACIYLHLMPNAYAGPETPFAAQQLQMGQLGFHFAKPAQYGNMWVGDCLSEGVNLKSKADGELLTIWPAKPLVPGDSMTFSLPFEVKLPSASFSRMGKGRFAYYLTQWYPKPAVYDRDGWHINPYLDMGEFYSEFGEIDVSITVPEGYTIAASGVKSSSNLHFGKLSEKFGIENAHDFAFFVYTAGKSKRGKVALSSGKEVSVEVHCVFPGMPDSLMLIMLNAARNSLRYFDSIIGPYPYANAKVVVGEQFNGGGMEYPGITLINPAHFDRFELEGLIAHELCHNWFYAAIGSNERAEPWIDEGLTTYYQYRYLQHIGLDVHASAKRPPLERILPRESMHRAFLLYAMARLPLQNTLLHSEAYDVTNYSAMVYYRSMRSIEHLEFIIGKEKVDRAIGAFYKSWQFRHPSGNDLRASMEAELGMSLDWLFKGMMGTNPLPDFRLHSRLQGDSILLRVQSGVDYPLAARLHFNVCKDSSMFLPAFRRDTTLMISSNAGSLSINNDLRALDGNPANNTVFPDRLFKGGLPSLKLFYTPPPRDKATLFLTPLPGWNSSDGFQAGLAFYNDPVALHGLHWVFLPFFATSGKSLTGYLRIRYNLPISFTDQLTFSMDASTFHNADQPEPMRYRRYKPGVELYWKPGYPLSKQYHQLGLHYYQIMSENAVYSSIIPEQYEVVDMNLQVLRLSYNFHKDQVLNPMHFNADLQTGHKMIRFSASIKQEITYDESGKGLTLRVYAGKFFKEPVLKDYDMRFTLNGLDGRHDYLYDGLFTDRSLLPGEAWIARTAATNGNFSMTSPYGQSWDYLATLNLSADFPGRLPLSVYGNFGTYADASDFGNGAWLKYDCGLRINVADDRIGIDIPILFSPEMKEWSNNHHDNFIARIRVSFDATDFNPFSLVEEWLR
jgi:hypothetical protein